MLHNTLITKILAGSALALCVSCSGSGNSGEARALLDGATGAFDNADYALATSLLDSLQKTFPGEIEIQREGMALRPKVIEQTTLLQISTNDSLMAADKIAADQLKPRLKWIKNPRMIEGYWSASDGYDANFLNHTGLQARVSEIGEFYVVSSMNPSSLRHTSVALSNGASSVATPEVPYDGESNYRISGSEVITFSPAQSDAIGQFALANIGKPLTLTFRGKGTKSVKLSATQVAGIADAYAYAVAVDRARRLNVERQRLEATLQLARNQIAKTTLDTTEE